MVTTMDQSDNIVQNGRGMRRTIQPRVGAFVVFALGCAVAAFVTYTVSIIQQTENQERFNALADRATAQLVRRIQVYEYGLRGSRGAVITVGIDKISRSLFQRYAESRELSREFPGSRGFGFIRRVPRANEAAFLRAARADGSPDFKIAELSEHDGDRLVIQYIEPEAANRQAVGLDIASESNRHQAALQSFRENRPTLTRPITLVQVSGKTGQGFLFFVPIYQHGASLDSPESRLSAAAGLAYTPLLIDDVLADFELFKEELSVSLYDADQPEAPRSFYASALAGLPAVDGLIRRQPVSLYGRSWLVEFKATPRFIDELNLPAPRQIGLQIVGGAALLAFLSYLLLLNARQRNRSTLDNARLAAIVTGTSDAVIGKDLRGVVTSWNQTAERMFGYSADEAIGRTLSDLIVPVDRLHEEQNILESIRRGESVAQFATQRRRRDGSLVDVAVIACPIRDASGAVVASAKTLRDITEQKMAETRILHLNATLETQVTQRTAQLAAVEHFLQSVVDAMPAMVGYWDPDLRCRFANRAYLEWFGRHKDTMIGMPIQELLGAELFQQNEPYMRAALQGTPQVFERTIVRPDGNSGHTLAHYLPDLENGTVRGFMVVVTDVTMVKHAEVALVDAKRRAEEATQAKSAFLANMSHEIRTPMNAILGLCYLLEKQTLPAVSAEMVQKIHGAGRALLGIINDILDFSKIEAQRLDIEHVSFRLSDVLDNLASIMASSLGKKALELVVASPPAGVDFLRGDSLRLGQVLINLAGNAIKFTDTGEVAVRVERGPDDAAGRVMLRFSVRDTGIGIPKDKQQLIFHAFSQADSSTTRNFGGSGLGLTISARLVELMGGQLHVESEPGRGSEFSFTLPFERSDPVDSVLPEMTHLRVLVADDHVTARAVLADTVGSLGWHADTADSGEQAIALACQSSTPHYDVLLLDWRMPGIDGLQAAAQIHELQAGDNAPVIIMVTAHDREVLREQIGNEVADIAINKPVTSSSLYNAVLQAKLIRGELNVRTLSTAHSARLTGLRLLIVDDSEINRDVGASILRGEGASVELAEDGSIAIAILQSRPTDFDVVLMDMQMPVMDGYAATRLVRATPQLARIPVVALTAGAFKSQRDLALEAGVDDFVAKPFEVEQLVAVILQLMERTRGHTPHATVPSPRAAPVPSRVKVEPETVALRDLDVARGLRVWNDPKVFGSYLHKFLANYDDAVLRIRETSPDIAARLVHKLRGAAAQLGLDVVASVAGKVEDMQLDHADAEATLAELQVAMASAKTAIEQYAPAPAQFIGMPAVDATVPDLAVLSDTLVRVLRALGHGDPGLVEPEFDALATLLPAARLQALRTAMANYDFAGAETEVNQIAATLHLKLEG